MYIQTTPRTLTDGNQFIECSGMASVEERYIFLNTQSTISLKNEGNESITLVVESTSYTLKGGEQKNISGSIDEFTVSANEPTPFTVNAWTMNEMEQLSELKKPLEDITIKVISESILGQGNFVSQLESKLGNSTIQAIYGGSYIGAALAEMADEVYAPCVGENSIKYSNDMTKSTWQTSADKTTTLETLNDGLVWNKVVKVNTTSSIGPRIDAVSPYPVGANGCVVSADVYVPVGTTPSPVQSLNFWLSNRTTLVGDIQQTVSNLIPGKKYRFVVVFDESNIVWTKGAGDTIRFMIQMNTSFGHAPCTAYFRNVSVSWMNDSVYEKYVPSLANFVAPGTSTWKELPKNPYDDDYEAVIISYGRNEADGNVSAKAHFRAYDKLIQNCLNKCGYVLPTNPPASYNTSAKQWANDSYVINGFNTTWDFLMKKWNSGVDVNSLFRSQSSPSTIMTDSAHQNENGAALMVESFAREIKARKIIPGSKAELTDNIRYYLSGIATGTWKRISVPTGVEQRLINSYFAYCMESSVQNDYLSFPSTRFQQLHIIYRQDPSYGSVDVIIDEGTANEQVITLNTAYAGVVNRFHGHFVCDFGNSDTHTVKVKVKDALTVRIHGIVVI